MGLKILKNETILHHSSVICKNENVKIAKSLYIVNKE